MQREGQAITNDEIRYPKVRLIGSDGSQLGIVSANEAREKANEEGLDLVEVSPEMSMCFINTILS